ncbi:hypothetical protein EV702DRAFT_1201558 [Suillus placidus]|uniref:Uncharacterized protein n=1 Tax=Suillus placidus TaxID=48579 RepID=A0A9P7CZA1_9AGAM|nr:hypothetical protein EV702DRAFT_1201558 [Suillus placidus]
MECRPTANKLKDWDALPSAFTSLLAAPDTNTDTESFTAFLTETPSISLICVTTHTTDAPASTHICHAHHIPVNVTDLPALCDFSFAATHRLQVERTHYNLNVLPKDIAGAIKQVRKLRYLAKNTGDQIRECEEGEDYSVSTPNRPLPSLSAQSLLMFIRRFHLHLPLLLFPPLPTPSPMEHLPLYPS